MKARSFYTDEITKDLMQTCKSKINYIQDTLKGDGGGFKLSPERRAILTDELVAIVDLMSYIDSRHKDYLMENLVDKKKAALKAMWQAFKLRGKLE